MMVFRGTRELDSKVFKVGRVNKETRDVRVIKGVKEIKASRALEVSRVSREMKVLKATMVFKARKDKEFKAVPEVWDHKVFPEFKAHRVD